MKHVRALTATGLALVIGACSPGATDSSDVALVEWSSSFGFCPPTAYCTTRLRISGTQAVLTRESRERPAQISTTELSEPDARGLARAAALARFEQLGPVLGCPDCADGGAENLSVTTATRRSSVTFEFNAAVPSLEPLLGQVRALVQRLQPSPAN